MESNEEQRDTRLKGRLRKRKTDLVTLGEQMRLLRELRGLSKAELARLMKCHPGTITKIERGFMESVSMRFLNSYLNQCYGTFIAIPLPMPSGVNHEMHRMTVYMPTYKPVDHNLAKDNEEPD